MPSARLCIDDSACCADALARARVVWDGVTADTPLVLYGAALQDDALLLGAYQRARDALSEAARSATVPVLRRHSGGITLRARPGVSYVAIGLYDRSTVMSCPPQRILNRNVRGALAGLRRSGLQAHYFGRDFISVDARPSVFIGWDARPDGRVLLELLLSESVTYVPPAAWNGYPPRHDDPLRAKEPITLQQAGVRHRGAALFEQLAAGYAEMMQATLLAQTPTADERRQAAAQQASSERLPEEEELTWSTPREEAIGFVSAGVALDASGKLSRVRLAGDFLQDRGCHAALQRALCGVEPHADAIGRALDTVYARSGHELEGVRKLENFREAILEAVAHARTRT